MFSGFRPPYPICVIYLFFLVFIFSFLLQEVSVAGWVLSHNVGDVQTDYKFHRSVKLGDGEVATVSAETDSRNFIFIIISKIAEEYGETVKC